MINGKGKKHSRSSMKWKNTLQIISRLYVARANDDEKCQSVLLVKLLQQLAALYRTEKLMVVVCTQIKVKIRNKE